MRTIRCGVVVLCVLLCCSATSIAADVRVGVGINIGLPNVRIGINVPIYPELVPVPGYPVYYAPRLAANYFFYDGMYWVYLDDFWYSSYWYNGPWYLVEPEFLPVFILRIPVRYYRYPPPYFRGWRPDAPPRWGEHWGPGWEHKRKGWDRWKRSSAPPRAPLPTYQRQYSGERYPVVEEQQPLQNKHYRYKSRDKAVRKYSQPSGEQRRPQPVRQERQEAPRMKGPWPQDVQRSAPLQTQPQQREPVLRGQRELQKAVPSERQAPRPKGKEQQLEDRRRLQEPRGQGQEQRKDEDRGRGRERDN